MIDCKCINCGEELDVEKSDYAKKQLEQTGMIMLDSILCWHCDREKNTYPQTDYPTHYEN